MVRIRLPPAKSLRERREVEGEPVSEKVEDATV